MAAETRGRHDLGMRTIQQIPVFFTDKMVADSGSFSPSAGKPVKVVRSWQKLDGVQLELHEPAPATPAEYKRAHEAKYVDDVLACLRPNGFGNRSPAVAASLPFTTGAMLSAARHVLEHGLPVAAAPCSGFHHAGFRSGGGFCTFNGLMVTAASLTWESRARRVGILDCDEHYGDGTDDILDTLDGARSWVAHYTAGEHWHFVEQAEEFLARLGDIVRDAMAGCDIVLYQAGADPHVNDPLGGWLTTEQLRRRDAIVFDTLRAIDIPVVWNLAGGYQVEADGSIPKVLEIHDNTMRECARVFAT